MDIKDNHQLRYYTDEELASPCEWDGEYPPMRLVRIQQIRVGDLYVVDYRQLRNRPVTQNDYSLIIKLVTLPFLDRESKTYEMETLRISDQKVEKYLFDNESVFRWFLVSRL